MYVVYNEYNSYLVPLARPNSHMYQWFVEICSRVMDQNPSLIRPPPVCGYTVLIFFFREMFSIFYKKVLNCLKSSSFSVPKLLVSSDISTVSVVRSFP